MDNEGRFASKLIAIGVLSFWAAACVAADGFESVKCGGDIPKALIGKTLGNEPVAKLEQRHKELALRDEGSEEISDAVSYIAWNICGASYHLLEHGGRVTDVVRADHSKAQPAFVGTCEVAGAPTPYVAFAILDASGSAEVDEHAAADDKTLLPARSAWRIDEARAKFVEMKEAKLACPRSGISTADGGP